MMSDAERLEVCERVYCIVKNVYFLLWNNYHQDYNDEFTRKLVEISLTAAIERHDDIKLIRVECDEHNNMPHHIDSNKLNVDIWIEYPELQHSDTCAAYETCTSYETASLDTFIHIKGSN